MPKRLSIRFNNKYKLMTENLVAFEYPVKYVTQVHKSTYDKIYKNNLYSFATKH